MTGGPDVRMLGPIASGGMGSVSLALRTTAEGTKVPVAIKKLHAHHAADPEHVAAFVDEARIASRIVHPNVTRIFDVDMFGEELVIVMDYIEGAPLSHLLRAQRNGGSSLPIPVACRIVHDALLGLEAAHGLRDPAGAPFGIVHRDVSPQNVLVGSDGVSRVTDFGIAVASGRLASTKNEQHVKGKLHYLSPEQIYRRGVDRRTDVFAAGNVLWECLTGCKLFAAGTEGETLAMILREPIAPPSALRMQVMLELDEVCLKALERDPSRRFVSAADFAAALAPFATATDDDVSRVVEAAAGDVLAERREMVRVGRTQPSHAPGASSAPNSRDGLGALPMRRLRWRDGAVALALVVGVIGGAFGMKLTSASSAPAIEPPLATNMAPGVDIIEAPTPPPPSLNANASADGHDDLEIMNEAATSASPAVLLRPAGRASSKARPIKPASVSARRTAKPFMPSDL